MNNKEIRHKNDRSFPDIFRNSFLILILALYLLPGCNNYCSRDDCIFTEAQGNNLTAIEECILNEINSRRLDDGQHPLIINPTLQLLARNHSSDMAKRDFFSHVTPEGNDPSDRAVFLGIEDRQLDKNTYLIGIAENIGKISIGKLLKPERVNIDDTPSSIASAQVRIWMKSKPHKKNILNRDFVETGIGVGFDGKYYIITQDFR